MRAFPVFGPLGARASVRLIRPLKPPAARIHSRGSEGGLQTLVLSDNASPELALIVDAMNCVHRCWQSPAPLISCAMLSGTLAWEGCTAAWSRHQLGAHPPLMQSLCLGTEAEGQHCRWCSLGDRLCGGLIEGGSLRKSPLCSCAIVPLEAPENLPVNVPWLFPQMEKPCICRAFKYRDALCEHVSGAPERT